MVMTVRYSGRVLRRLAASSLQVQASHSVRTFSATSVASASQRAVAAAPVVQHRLVARRRFAGGGDLLTLAVKDFGAESITEGTLVDIRKKVGDSVSKGELLASIETDKVTVEFNAEAAGIIKEILAKADDNVLVGQGLFKIEVGAAGAAPAGAGASLAAPAAAAPAGGGKVIEQSIKDFGAESITEGTLMEWRKKVGEAVAEGEIIAVIETDKVAIELTAEASGVVKEILVQPDETVTVGKVLVKIEAGAGGTAAPAASAQAAAAPAAAAAVDMSGLSGIRAGFALARAAREAFAQGLPPPGTAAPAPAAAAPKPAAAAPAAVSVGEGRTERRVPLSPMRHRIIQRQKDAQNAMALLTTFQEVDMTAALEVRTKYQDIFKKKNGVPLGLLSLFAKACASGLEEMPGVNGFIDDASQEMVYRSYCDISVPIPSPRGPVSCILRNTEAMSISEIEQTIARLSLKALKDELAVEDLSPASFGIVDNGVSGSMLSTSLINAPASAVLGTNAIMQRAVFVGGKVVARPVMYVALTYDHRLVDGREAVTFLGGVRDKLEDPTRLLLEV